MIQLDTVLINDDVLNTKFCCDLEKCKGHCCVLEGGFGAPIENNEILKLKEVFPIVKNYLSEKSLEIIEQKGFFEGLTDNFYITCIDDKDCVFVYYENEIAKCAIEKAYFDGLIKWRKPISCHLYPIRVVKFGDDILKYSKIGECAPAVKNGKKNNVFLYDFLKESLVRKFGDKWYSNFKEYCDSLNIEQ